MSKFKIGDRVRYLKGGYTFSGKEGVVIEVEDEYYTLDLGRGQRIYPAPTDLMELVEASPTPRGEILLEAKNLIEGDRNISYGEPTQNFTNIAGVWTILFAHKLKDGELFTPAEVADAMIALKLCRSIADRKRDTAVDIAGYAAAGYEAHEAYNAQQSV